MVKKRAIRTNVHGKSWRMPHAHKASIDNRANRQGLGPEFRSGTTLIPSQVLDLRGMTTAESDRAIRASVTARRNARSARQRVRPGGLKGTRT